MRKQLGLTALIILAGGLSCTAPVTEAPARSAEEILLSYVEDFRSDPVAAEPIVFGIVVKGAPQEQWHVEVTGRREGAEVAGVELRRGLPEVPAPLYTLDLATLRQIDRGEINALTAMGKARASDLVPMDIGVMPGFRPEAGFFDRFIPFSFHFWTRGFPEMVPFGREYSREVHGANAVIFYYQRGLRSAWCQVESGQHVNPDPRDQSNPFPTMIIGIRGRAMVKIGGIEQQLEAGRMVFIPAGVTHESWNPFSEPAEVILLMFGEGA